ncbi:MAG: thrombospondin type 3 repeat-containing protein [Deltaproteobacteria bacterium]|nr:thrombospondin type 3 repeat-containing protein [Deltaproteobacteria bacterium]
MAKSCAWFALVVLAGCGAQPDETPTAPRGELIGRVEVSEDVPTADCRVLLEGTPLGAPCDANGTFDIRGVPPGRWDLRVVSGPATALPGKRLAAAANAGLVTDLGVVRLSKPGAVGGRVAGAPAGTIIALPAYGVVTAPNSNGGYLLTGAPPGVHDLVMITPAGTLVRTPVTIVPARTTIGVDFDGAATTPVSAPIKGTALRGDDVPGGDGDLTVELVDAATGAVVTSDRTAADGAFELSASSGMYVVRARDGQNPATAILPSVVPLGGLGLRLPVPLVVPVPGDLDHDGDPDSSDADIDNDGVPNAADKFPFDPAESADADNDGLGDRADLATSGAGLDTHNPTPDTDADGRFDFEDVCPMVPDPAQRDADGDRVGDLCDNCPGTPNPGQEDSVGDKIGDVCRLCDAPEDCPADKICRFGRCVDCASSSQCNGKICDAQGACVACTASAQCGGTRKCNLPLGICQDCMVSQDCAAGQACLQGRCFAECTVDRDCGSGFCAGGACVSCRSNADCPLQEWCDAGLCRPGCVTDASCGGARVCELSTRTCVLPCSATCPTGQTCDAASVCRQACDLSFPCPGNQICVSGSCRPECSVNGDCTGGKLCQLGQCVASGLCTLDTQCPASQVCSPTGACVARTTAFDAAAGAYLCSQACQCKLGETCSGGHCLADGVPTRFVAAGGLGDGLTLAAPTGSLTTALAGLGADDVIALRAGDSFEHNGLPLSIEHSGVRLQGGYVACSSSRWVRDGALRSRLHKADDAQPTLLTVPGTLLAQRTGVALKGLTLAGQVPADGVLADVTFAPGLAVDGLTLELTTPGSRRTMTGLLVTSSTAVSLGNISMPSFSQEAVLDVVRLRTSAGAIRGLALGDITNAWSVRGLVIEDPVGAVDVEAPVLGTWTFGNSSAGIVVSNSNRAPARITGGRAAWSTASSLANAGGVIWSVVWVDGSSNVTVSGLVVDGTGFIDPFASAVHASASAVHFTNSSGVIDRVAVTVPRTPSFNYARPFWIEGPQGGVTLTDCTVNGDGTVHNRLVSVENVVSGVTTVNGGTFALAQTPSSAESIGFRAASSLFRVTGASFSVPAQAQSTYGFWVSAGSGRIERSRFQADGIGTSTSSSLGGYADGGALELYSSWLLGGSATTSVGFEVGNTVQLHAVGNTFHGGNPTSVAGTSSAGVLCYQDAGTLVMRDNLIHAGAGPDHPMLVNYGGSAGPCTEPTSWDHNYFSFTGAARSPTDAVGQVALGQPGVADLRGNVIGDGVSCFDPAFPAPDFHIAAGSACVNQGVLATRADGSAITLDLLGGARVLGGAPDIGCHEKQ